MRSSHLELLKVEAVAPFGSAHDIHKVRREDKWYTLPVHAKEVFPVAQDVTKVNVKQVPWEAQHIQRQLY